jgi:alanine racemase
MTTRPCWVEISTQSLEDNYRYLKSLAADEAELLAVVKSNAYGHSLDLCAPAVVRAGAAWLGVTSVEEAVATRAVCADARLLVMSGCYPGEGAIVLEHGLTAVAWEPWQLDELESAAIAADVPEASVNVHLEIDTGMSRQGVGLHGLEEILKRFGPESPLRLEGLVTHLYAADESDGCAMAAQMECLDEAIRRVSEAGLVGGAVGAEWLNVGSSAALLRGGVSRIAALAAKWGLRAMIRPGLALYGVAPKFVPDEPLSVTLAREFLKPVLSWKTRVVSVRQIPAGAVVGYNGTFVATEPMRLALLAVGYADGLDRGLGNRFSLLVRGARAPLVGRISMDLAVLDVTEIHGVAAGDEVVILGSQGGETGETITAFDHAEATGTIPWEVFTRIGARVARTVVSCQ